MPRLELIRVPNDEVPLRKALGWMVAGRWCPESAPVEDLWHLTPMMRLADEE